ncbi:hypothetical protein GTQ99_10350 [Kineococcus sp. T13]|uniref:hypothetical protein n=1 Tax=Kineococcus vitellinus TaxID=2696565 RepID=UPI0014127F47|nr:hypothetical protein [Kineococcus vitellinus]NAZ75810.1 hypothetical protein [Kineococcus vitellinus]
MEENTGPTNTGAIAGLVASGAGLLLSLVLWPLSLLMGLAVLVLGVRALRGGHPDRRWWAAALALAAACVLSAAGSALALATR